MYTTLQTLALEGFSLFPLYPSVLHHEEPDKNQSSLSSSEADVRMKVGHFTETFAVISRSSVVAIDTLVNCIVAEESSVSGIRFYRPTFESVKED